MILTLGSVSRCHRCQGELSLVVEAPHPSLPGMQKLPLCPRCDAHDPAAHGILAFFAANSVVDVATQDEAMALTREWLDARQRRHADATSIRLGQDLTAWRNGDFD